VFYFSLKEVKYEYASRNWACLHGSILAEPTAKLGAEEAVDLPELRDVPFNYADQRFA
jgi:hypothetical protein